MSRLVQGDVGSGKDRDRCSISASECRITKAIRRAMMAPTEVLARQHYESITSLFEEYNIPIKDSAFDRFDDGKRKTRRHTTGSSADWRRSSSGRMH